MNPLTTFLHANRLLMAARAEATRAGHADIDLDDLLLGLLAQGGAEARRLDRHGVTLPRAREAAADVVREDLAVLGLGAPPATVRVSHGDNYRLTERADQALNRMSGALRGFNPLSALLTDRHGLVPRIVEGCGGDVDAILSDDAPVSPARRDARWGAWNGSTWTAAPREQAWRAVHDPERVATWLLPGSPVEAVGGDAVRTVTDEPGPGDELWRRVDADATSRVRWECVEHLHLAGQFVEVTLHDDGSGTRLEYRMMVPAAARLGAVGRLVSRIITPLQGQGLADTLCLLATATVAD